MLLIARVKNTFTYSFNVNLKAIKGIAEASSNVLFVKFDAFLLEKVLDGRFSNIAVVELSVLSDSPLHIIHSIVSSEDLIFWEFSHPVDQFSVCTLEDDNTARVDIGVYHMLVKAGLLAFF